MYEKFISSFNNIYSVISINILAIKIDYFSSLISQFDIWLLGKGNNIN